jgi:isoleucyl-tRNA synthetase
MYPDHFNKNLFAKKCLPQNFSRLLHRREMDDAPSVKDTLNLPRTGFPLRASPRDREPGRIAHWRSIGLYGKIQEARRDAPPFLLHDGPPFTNGDVHIGTALNKVLKDIIIRYKTMRGFRAAYVPGWDCHGLPIEHKVARRAEKQLSPVELREECAKFSRDFSKKQRQQFERLGLLADWDREYRTMDPAYEAEVLEFFARCVGEGLVQWHRKPVYWSIPCRTALAEAEIEYRDITGPSIWVKFPLVSPAAAELSLAEPVHLVAWTTTPWSLPANRAIAVHPDFSYAALRCGDETFIVESSAAERFIGDCHLEGVSFAATIPGSALLGRSVRHPLVDRNCPVIAARFVDRDVGTGCVHIAPAHGAEDYAIGRENSLEVYCPVGDDGRYASGDGIPEELIGVSLLEGSGGCPANAAVCALLRRGGRLLGERSITHSYPHCWRSKTPVIQRATPQWFLNLEREDLRRRAMDAVESVNWLPEWGKNRISAAIATRPDWCISRQRAWGIPLPAFFDGDRRPYLDGGVIRGIAAKVRQCGADCWFRWDSERLLDGISLPDHWKGKALSKGSDTLDVWIDSGCSFRALPKLCPDLHFPADLYVEGSDQHRGWFQSSLWCAVISGMDAPFRGVLTHGFVVGEDRKKISKSDGKPQSADDYVNRYGADVVRLWIASEDFRGDTPISETILRHISDSYATIRNTLRYQLGNLYDFDAARDAVPMDRLLPIDRWALEKTRQLILEATAAYESFEFHRIHRAILQFCTVTLSATYHDMLKDRLYTCGAKWEERRSAQTAMDRIFHALIALLLPILPFTADEAYAHRQVNGDFAPSAAHLLDWPDAGEFSGSRAVAEDVDRILSIRTEVNRQLEIARQRKILGKSLDGRVILEIGRENAAWDLLHAYGDHLMEIFIVSQVVLEGRDGDGLTVRVEKAVGSRCDRSWRWCEELFPVRGFGNVSSRCRKVLLEMFPDLQ